MENTLAWWNQCGDFHGVLSLPCQGYYPFLNKHRAIEGSAVFRHIAFDTRHPANEDRPYLRPAYQSASQEIYMGSHLVYHPTAAYSFATFPPMQKLYLEEFTKDVVVNLHGVTVKDALDALCVG